MVYQVIARKWRPMIFEDIIGQEHITITLKNAIESNRIAHAYIFSGPRGVGKTSAARIFAKALNCENGPASTPCNECSTCKDITRGANIDVLEIDGASNNGVEEVRNLRDKIRFTPTTGKYKIYIIDEVHMLTTNAFNALLKTLEEPPEHAIFIFATTEIHKVLSTILSRCQRYDFKSIPVKQIISRLEVICSQEHISISKEAMLEIAKKADGGMRDAQSLLDQVISFTGSDISIENVRQALGLIDRDLFFLTSESIAKSDNKEILKLVNHIIVSGHDIAEFLTGLEEHFRNILVAKIVENANDLEVSELYQKKYMDSAEKFSESDLLKYVQLIQESQIQLKRSFQPRLKFELLLLRLAQMPSVITVESIIKNWDKIKKKILNNSEKSLNPDDNVQNQKNIASDKESAIEKHERLENSLSKQPVQEISEEIDLEKIRELWKQCINLYIESRKTFLANQMSLGMPVKYEGNGIIKIGYSTENQFAADHLQKSTKEIEKYFSERLNKNIRIDTIAYQFETESKPKPVIPETVRFEDLLQNEPKIKDMMDKFDAKLVRITPKK